MLLNVQKNQYGDQLKRVHNFFTFEQACTKISNIVENLKEHNTSSSIASYNDTLDAFKMPGYIKSALSHGWKNYVTKRDVKYEPAPPLEQGLRECSAEISTKRSISS